MDKTLMKLFDFQKFAGNPQLQAVIDSAHKGVREWISDESADLVAAAGTANYQPASSDKKESHQ